LAGLGAYSEGELDTWFATRGVSRADLREQFLPFGDGLWFERFPRYANALRGDLGAYEALLGQAMTRRGGDRDTLGLASRMAAIEDARITVRTLLADGRLREVTSLRLSYRLSLEYLSLFEPAVDTYRLPPFAGEAYNARAPYFERGGSPQSVAVSISSDSDTILGTASDTASIPASDAVSVPASDAASSAVSEPLPRRGRSRMRGRGGLRGSLSRDEGPPLAEHGRGVGRVHGRGRGRPAVESRFPGGCSCWC
jgi:hypothetical protein